MSCAAPLGQMPHLKVSVFRARDRQNLTGVTVPDFVVINGKFSECLNLYLSDLCNGVSELLLQSITSVNEGIRVCL